MLTCIGGATSVWLLRESSAWMAREERERFSFECAFGAGPLPAAAGLTWRALSLTLVDIIEEDQIEGSEV